MHNDYSQFEQRKRDHIELALMPANQSSECNPFDALELVHEAIPNLNFADISLQSQRFGACISTPFFVSSMTAGHANAVDINKNLMEACAISGWAMGVGSQRRELSDQTAAYEWAPLRQAYPKVQVFSNLGIAQLITTPLPAIQRLIDALQASALIVHCNPLQECIQPEGTTDFEGSWKAIEHVVQKLPIPVVIKETGCGFSKKTLLRLHQMGVAAVDVSGLGGTHWGRIEGHRAQGQPIKQATATTFRNWGITTVQSLRDAASLHPCFEIWGSGGVRNGLDAAKLFALGALSVGFAKPMLEAALHSTERVCTNMSTIEYELKTAMFCTGSRVLSDLKEAICL